MQDFRGRKLRRIMRPYVLSVTAQRRAFEALRNAKTAVELAWALNRLDCEMESLAVGVAARLGKGQSELFERKRHLIQGCILGLVAIWMRSFVCGREQHKYSVPQYRRIIGLLVRKNDPTEYKRALFDFLLPMVQIEGFRVCPVCLELFAGRPSSTYCARCSRSGSPKKRKRRERDRHPAPGFNAVTRRRPAARGEMCEVCRELGRPAAPADYVLGGRAICKYCIEN